MKITEYGAIRSASDLRRRRLGSTSQASFAEFLDAPSGEDAAASASLSDVAASANVSNMLALQEISDEEVSRKKLIQKGKNLLDSLERLRQQLLIGAVPLHTLQDLSKQLAMQRQAISDPQLLAIIDDIELRAAVELAKLEQAAASQQSADSI